MEEAPLSPTAVQRSFSEEFLTCSVCLEHYSQPRHLACQHSFCTLCLEAIIFKHAPSGSFPCPLCSRNYPISDEGVHAFNVDFRLNNILDYMQETRQEEPAAEAANDEADDVVVIQKETLSSIASTFSNARDTKKKIKHHLSLLKTVESQYICEYDNLLVEINNKEQELISIVQQACDNYRRKIKRHKYNMAAMFKEESNSMKESKWFLSNCLSKFTGVLNEGVVTCNLPLLQLEATCNYISAEEFCVPRWEVPRLKLTPKQTVDHEFLDSLIGELTIPRERKVSTVSNISDAETEDNPETTEDEKEPSDDRRLSNISVDSTSSEARSGIKRLFKKKNKKRNKYLAIGRALITSSPLTMMFSPKNLSASVSDENISSDGDIK